MASGSTSQASIPLEMANIPNEPTSTEKSHFCAFRQNNCLEYRIEPNEYCYRHILQSNTHCLLKQCTYTSQKTGRRCTYAVVKMDKKDGYCPEHTKYLYQMRKKVLFKSARNQSDKPRVLNSLNHYIDGEASPRVVFESGGRRRSAIDSSSFCQAKNLGLLDDFVNTDGDDSMSMSLEQLPPQKSGSDQESDAEEEDPLRYASVYTPEELSLMLQEKLKKLETLYLSQMGHIGYLLRKNRREYILNKGTETTSIGSIYDAKNDDSRTTEYSEFTALKRARKYRGEMLLAKRKLQEKRLQSRGVVKSTHFKCAFTEAGYRCNRRTIPHSKFCMQHITEDRQQMLFKRVASESGDKIVAVIDISSPVVEAPIDESLMIETLSDGNIISIKGEPFDV